MKVYTKTGDKGATGLYDGKRVSKSSLRVEAYGTIDELTSSMGVAKCYLEDRLDVDLITAIQRRLFDVGADLATLDGSGLKNRIGEEDVTVLEKAIDNCLKQVDSNDAFIIPGDEKKSAHLHMARTVARRAERRMVSLLELVESDPQEGETPINPYLLQYVNRLSDFLYALARKVESGYTEVIFDK